jgi:predicted Zn-dependent protease
MIRFVRTSMLTALWQASVGDYSGLFVIDPRTALDVASLRFSRDDERDADEGALARLDTAHISREGFGAFFDRMREKTDLVPAWLSSHPASAERIATIRGAAARTDDRSASRALSSADWAALKGGCQKK